MSWGNCIDYLVRATRHAVRPELVEGFVQGTPVFVHPPAYAAGQSLFLLRQEK